MLRTPDLAGAALDGRYELHAMIGEGAFGRVYSGVDRRLERAVAVKVIKPWWAEDSAWVARFEREAQLLARVSDPGIVQIFDIGHAEEGPYYVAELVEGESLAERLQRGPIDPEQARSIAEQLCRALASAHAQGVVHCDVKPANVLLATDGRVKVGDFGVARLAAGTSQAPSATVAGTPRYMSPEQARGRPTTAATDVYSAGVVLYEMLTGAPPFTDGSPVELGLRHLQDAPPPLPKGVPAQLGEIVERALAKDPAERFGDGAAMAQALDAARSTSAEASKESPASPLARANTADAKTIDLAAAQTRVTPADRTKVLPRRALDGAGGASGSPPGPSPGDGGRSRHRSRRAAVSAALAVAAGGALAVFMLARPGAHTTVPELRGLPRGGVVARARRLHVKPVFSTRHAVARSGTAIAQDPSAGTRTADGASVEVVLSSGPPPVEVPSVVGRPSSEAESRLAKAGLRYSVKLVAATDSEPGVVASQSPNASTTAPRGSTVALSVAEEPHWRALTSFSGVDDGRSVAFRILGKRWRVAYSMSYTSTCLLLVVCLGPSAHAQNLNTDASVGSFDLGEGSSQTHTFDTGPGLYQLAVSGGHDPAKWSMTVEDYY